MKFKTTSFKTLAFIICTFFSATLMAQTGTFNIITGTWTSGSSSACTWNAPTFTVGEGANITIAGMSSITKHHIVVEEHAKNVQITLNNIMLICGDYPPIQLRDGSEATITIGGTYYGSDIRSAGPYACIQVPEGAKLTINGSGKLSLLGLAGGAAIGAGVDGICGTVIIDNGNINTTTNPPEWLPEGTGPEFFYYTGYSYDPGKDLYYLRNTSLQQRIGTAYGLDELHAIATKLDFLPIYFIYDNKEWVIQMKKGQYHLGTGAEIGVYNRGINDPLLKQVISDLRIPGIPVEEFFLDGMDIASYLNQGATIGEAIITACEIFKMVTDSFVDFMFDEMIVLPDYLDLIEPLKDDVRDFTSTSLQYLIPNDLQDIENRIGIGFNIFHAITKLDAFDLVDIDNDFMNLFAAFYFGLKSSKFYKPATDDEMLYMKYDLYDKMSGGALYNYLYGMNTQRHWRLASEKPGKSVHKGELQMDATIWFPTEAMRDAFLTGYDDYTSMNNFSKQDIYYFDIKNPNPYDNHFVNRDYGAAKKMRSLSEMSAMVDALLGYAFPINNMDDYRGFLNYHLTSIPSPTLHDIIRMFSVYESLPVSSEGYGVRILTGRSDDTPNLARGGMVTNAVNNSFFINRSSMYNDLKTNLGCSSNDPNEMWVKRSPAYSGQYSDLLFGLGTDLTLPYIVPSLHVGTIAQGIGGVGGDIRINGGTLHMEAPEQSYGIYGNTNIITGGSTYPIGGLGLVEVQPKNTNDEPVYMITITGVPAETAITGSVMPLNYNVTGMQTDTAGKLYMWLPEGQDQRIRLIAANGYHYVGIVEVTNDNKATGELEVLFFCDGYGAPWAPFLICTPEELDMVRNYPVNRHFKLNNDIDLANYLTIGDGFLQWGAAGWLPINLSFNSGFDGNGYAIKNLTINRPGTDEVGLFGRFSGNYLKNLGIAGGSVTGKDNVGGIAGWKYLHTIQDCYTTCDVQGVSNVGGVVGYNQQELKNCFATGNISGADNVGGVAGNCENSLNNCYATGNVSGNDNVGGVAGLSLSGANNCFATGKVMGNDYVGGIVGRNASIVSSCVAANDTIKATGTHVNRITGSFGTTLAGYVFDNYANEAMIVNTGTVTGNGTQHDENGTDTTFMTLKTFNFYNTQTHWDDVNNAIWDIAKRKDSTKTWQICDSLTFPFFQWEKGKDCVVPFCYGEGTPEDPYHICTAAQLDSVRYFLDKHFILKDDIDLKDFIDLNDGVAGWEPIGTLATPFTGSFNGKGHKITGLWVNRTTDYVGLFGNITTAKIDSVGVEITAAGVKGENYVGGLVGESSTDSYIAYCYTTGTINGHTGVGGLVGYNDTNATILNCYTTANVTGNSGVGGLVGYNEDNSTLLYSYATGKVKGNGPVGGLVGENITSTITNCVAANDSITGITNVNRMVGNNSGTLNHNYANEDMMVNNAIVTTGANNNENGENKLLTDLKGFVFYDANSNWDFAPWSISTMENLNRIWRICEGATFPFFQWEDREGCGKHFCGGEGTQKEPYLICTASQLDSVRYFLDKYFILNNNIDLKDFIDLNGGVAGWLPIGDYTSPFEGNFNGAGHIITGLWLNTTNDDAGLFGSISNAAIYDLGVELDAKGITSAATTVGGLVGNNSASATLNNCYVAGTGTVKGDSFVGALAGGNTNYATIANCYATVNVTGNSYVGGLVGINDQSFVANCYATGKVGEAGANKVGGLVGTNSAGAILANCVAANDSVLGASDVNRIAGSNSASLTHNYANETMIVNTAIVSGSLTDVNGANKLLNDFKKVTFYNNSTLWDGAPWSIASFPNLLKIWKICDGETLPILQWEQGGSCALALCDSGVIWKHNFGGDYMESYHSVAALSDGVVAVGNAIANSFGTGDWIGVSGKGNTDAVIVKYDKHNNVAWKKNFGGAAADYFNAVAALSDGIVAAGYADNSSFSTGDWAGAGVTGKGNYDAIIVKYDHSGNIMWRKNFGGSANDQYNSVIAVADGIIAVGYSEGGFNAGDWTGVTGNGGTEAIIVKYDHSGNVVCKKHFGGSNYDRYTSVTAAADGIIAAGASAAASFGTGDWADVPGNGASGIVVKYDHSGNVVWKNKLNGGYNSVVAVAGGVVAVGSCSTFNTGDWAGIPGKGNTDAIIAKHDNNGNVVWKKSFGGSDLDEYQSVVALPDGIVTVGVSYGNSFGNGDWAGVSKNGNDAIIIKYDNSGNLVWKKHFGSNGTTTYQSAAALSEGIVVAGYASGFGTGDWTGFTEKGLLDAIMVKHGCDPPTPAQMFCAGAGTPTDPYLICTAAQLDSIRYFLDKHFVLVDDIDILDGTFSFDYTGGWLPIGTPATPFTGTLNGAGHTITNLWINRTTNYVGLFGNITTAKIDSVGVEIAAAGVKGGNYVGGLAGAQNNASAISNCYVKGNVAGSGASSYTGGLVGYSYNSTIANCYSVGNISGNCAGGLVGYNLGDAAIENCHASGTVRGTGTSAYVGGIVGQSASVSLIKNCVAAQDSIFGAATTTRRIAGASAISLTLTRNYANQNMEVNHATVSGATGDENGVSTSLPYLNSFSFYNSAGNWDGGTAWNIDETANTTNIWRACPIGFLPYFQWEAAKTCPVPPDSIYGLLFNVADGKFYLDKNYNADYDAGTDTEYTGQAGNWSFSADTLYLDNFVWETFAERALTIVNGGVTLNVTGTNTFKSTSSAMAIGVGYGNLCSGINITGSGELNAYGGNDPQTGTGYGIYMPSLIVNGATVNAFSGASAGAAIMAVYDLTIDGGTVTAIAENIGAVTGNYGNISFQSGSFTAQGSRAFTVGDYLDINLPAGYAYWTSATLPYTPTGYGTPFPGGAAFVNSASYLFVKISDPISHHFCGGDGSPADPYQICTAAQLDSVRYFLDKHFILNNNININDGTLTLGVSGWEPIGTDANRFTGTFNGNKKFITNLFINRPSEDYVGLFGMGDGDTIFNVGIEGCNITGRFAVGGIMGYHQNGSITNCYVTGDLTGDNCVGALVGVNYDYSTIAYCYATGNVVATNSPWPEVGGLVGFSHFQTYIMNCVAANTSISGNVASRTSRVMGVSSGATLFNNYADRNMLVDGVTVTGIHTNRHGADQTLATLKQFSFYNTGTNWNGTAWDMDTLHNLSKIWRICTTGTLPFFQGQIAVPCPPVPTITATAGSNGIINPAGVITVTYNDNQIITFTPNTGYHIDSVYVNGTPISPTNGGGGYTFYNVTGDSTIHVTFAIDTFKIVATHSANGIIAPAGTINVTYGSNQNFTFTPNTGGRVDSVYVNGIYNAQAVTDGFYTFINVTGDATIHVTFVRNSYTITATAGSRGEITPSGIIAVLYGDDAPFTFAPKTPYIIDQVLIDGVHDPVAAANLTYTFTFVEADHTIEITFVCPPFCSDLVNNFDYNVIEVAGLCWTKENLRATLDPDGNPIAFAKPYEHPQYQDVTQNENDFGLLYDWYSAVMALRATPLQGICPNGWRLPTSAELLQLNMHPADDLRNPTYWLQPNTNTNLTGFDSRGAGIYNSALNRFENLYGYTTYWSSDDVTENTCNAGCLNYYCGKVEIVKLKLTDGASVRCVIND